MKEVTTVDRRRFVVTAGGALAAAGAAAVVDAPHGIAQHKVQWWTPALDVLQGAAEQLARLMDEVSGGRFRIEVFLGGQIVPPFECFEAASPGKIDAFMGASYYWVAEGPGGAVVLDRPVRQ
jgi:TRAP-type mannitol/chloroaromatic compound transport system substrate-binding protein